MSCQLIDLNSIKKQILISDCITFDVFDTLVLRASVFEPSDLFYHLALSKGFEEKRALAFMHDRVRAESLSRDKMRKCFGHSEINISNIYELLNKYPDINEEDEIEFERKVLVKRPLVEKIYKIAKEYEKPVFAISDFYMPSEILKPMLESHGYFFDAVYVSCDYASGKYDRGLFRRFLQAEGINSQRVLHFGDNRQADFDMACAEGLNAIHIPKALDMLFIDTSLNYKSLDLMKSGAGFFSKSCLAYIARRFESEKLSMARQFGALYAGPLIFLFIQWLYKSMKADGVNKLFLMARDGYTLAAAIDAMGIDISFDIMKCSRRALMLPAVINNKSNWATFFYSSSELSINDVIDGLYLEESSAIKILAFEIAPNCKCFEDFSNQQKSDFLEKSLILAQNQIEHEHSEFVRYLRDLGVSDETAVVDVGWSLSSQRALEEMTGQQIPGYYLGTSETAHMHDLIKSFLFEKGSNSDWKNFFYNSIELLELPFISTENQNLCIKNGSFVEKEPDELEMYRRIVADEIRDEVVKFCSEFASLNFSNTDFIQATDTMQKIYLNLGASPTVKEHLLIGSIPHDRHITGTGRATFADYWKLGQPIRSEHPYNSVSEKSIFNLMFAFLMAARRQGVIFAFKRSLNFFVAKLNIKNRTLW